MFNVSVLENFTLGDNHLGKAVFARRPFKPGGVVTQFKGPIVIAEQIPYPLVGKNDRYVQIGEGIYMGPSNEVDDYINHSCDPNTGLLFTDLGILMVAIKDIAIGDEITWDYSTTLYNDPWTMKCECNTPTCRGIIKEFKHLPEELKRSYLKQKIVSKVIADKFGHLLEIQNEGK